MSLDRLAQGAGLLAAVLVAGGLVWWLAVSTEISPVGYALAAAFIAADAVRGLEMSLLNAARRQREQAIRGMADAFARPLLAVLALAWLGSGPSQALLGFVAGSVLVSAALRRSTVRGEHGDSHRQDDGWVVANSKAFFSYALPLAPLNALNWVMSLGSRYVLAAISDASAVGTYAAATAVASQPFIAATALVHTTLRPVLYDAVASSDRAKERRILRVWLAVTVAIAVLGTAAYAVLAPWLTRLVLGPLFGDVAPLLPWISLAYGLQSVQHTFEIMMYAHGQTRRLMALQAVAAVVASCAYLVLIPRYGTMGAAWSTLATFVVTCATAAVMASAPRRLLGSGGV
jgi:O-antigen/teichoic acid export membrane protein